MKPFNAGRGPCMQQPRSCAHYRTGTPCAMPGKATTAGGKVASPYTAFAVDRRPNEQHRQSRCSNSRYTKVHRTSANHCLTQAVMCCAPCAKCKQNANASMQILQITYRELLQRAAGPTTSDGDEGACVSTELQGERPTGLTLLPTSAAHTC